MQLLRSSLLLSTLCAVILAKPQCSPKNWKHCLKSEKTPATYEKKCKVVPGDAAWPSEAGWRVLNDTVKGNLIKVVPFGAVCHDSFEGVPTFDPQACAQVHNDSLFYDWHQTQPATLLMAATYYNHTCSIYEDRDQGCTIGTLPIYSVDAQSVKDVQAAVNWARNNNIRLTVRNTGHDFMGKSIGASSLSIWTHNFREMKFIKKFNAKGEKYKGSAVKLGSGWYTEAIYEELSKRGKVIVGGECEGVGFSGGYIQGGGHGPLTGHYGMGADNALEFELVLPNGDFITANAGKNSDIFWALRGGGGASWGVVTSVTVKTYDDVSSAVATLHFDPTLDADTAWAGIEAFHGFSPKLVEEGMYVYYHLGFGMPFGVVPLLAPKWTAAQLDAHIAPLLAELDTLGVRYTYHSQEYSNFITMYREHFGEPPEKSVNPQPYILTSRIISKEHIESNNHEIIKLWREMADAGFFTVGHMFHPGSAPNGVLPETSINPKWKDNMWLPLQLYFVNPANFTNSELQASIDALNAWDARQKTLTPGTGAYLNEGNIHDPNWQQEFYGSVFPRLASIKEKYDPWGVFYAETAVGSQNWKKVGAKDRLCPV